MRLFNRRPRPGAGAELERSDSPAAGRLFIMGAPRTGTTVLQNALNASPEVFLLGEPRIYADEAPGFRARYNAMHRDWGNQETKSTYLPAFILEDGGWRDHLAATARHHRWVGAKLVINPVRAEDELQHRFDLHTREFYTARYIFTFRPPLAAVASTRDLQVLTGRQSDGLKLILKNYVEVIGLFIRSLRLLPHVKAVFHDSVDTDLFLSLGAWLGVPLTDALLYYDARRVRSYEPSTVDAGFKDVLAAASELYLDLRAAAAAGPDRPQLEQNDQHLSPNHYLPLGSLDRRARVIAAALA